MDRPFIQHVHCNGGQTGFYLLNDRKHNHHFIINDDDSRWFLSMCKMANAKPLFSIVLADGRKGRMVVFHFNEGLDFSIWWDFTVVPGWKWFCYNGMRSGFKPCIVQILNHGHWLSNKSHYTSYRIRIVAEDFLSASTSVLPPKTLLSVLSLYKGWEILGLNPY